MLVASVIADNLKGARDINTPHSPLGRLGEAIKENFQPSQRITGTRFMSNQDHNWDTLDEARD